MWSLLLGDRRKIPSSTVVMYKGMDDDGQAATISCGSDAGLKKCLTYMDAHPPRSGFLKVVVNTLDDVSLEQVLTNIVDLCVVARLSSVGSLLLHTR